MQELKPPVESFLLRYAKGALWNLLGTGGGRFFAFIASIIAARILGQVGFGELGMIQSTVGLLGTFAGSSVGMTATKYVAELKNSNPERTGRVIALTYLVSLVASGIMALGCFLGAPWIAAKALNAPHLAPELILATIFLVVSVNFGVQSGIMAGFQAFRELAMVSWWQGFFTLPLTFLLAWFAGLRGVIWALILSYSLGVLLSSRVLGRIYQDHGIRLDFWNSREERDILWHFSLPTFIAQTLYTSLLWGASALLVHQPRGYAQLGLFNAAMQFYWIILNMIRILGRVALPMLSEFYGQGDKEQFAKMLNVNLKFIWTIAIAGGFLGLACSPLMVKIFGDKFQAMDLILPLVICYTVVQVATNFMGQALSGSGKMWIALGIIVSWGIILFSLEVNLIQNHGAMGLAISFLFANLFILILHFCIIFKLFGKRTIIDLNLNFISCILLIVCGFLLVLFKDNIIVYIIPIIISLSLFTYFFYNRLPAIIKLIK